MLHPCFVGWIRLIVVLTRSTDGSSGYSQIHIHRLAGAGAARTQCAGESKQRQTRDGTCPSNGWPAVKSSSRTLADHLGPGTALYSGVETRGCIVNGLCVRDVATPRCADQMEVTCLFAIRYACEEGNHDDCSPD